MNGQGQGWDEWSCPFTARTTAAFSCSGREGLGVGGWGLGLGLGKEGGRKEEGGV